MRRHADTQPIPTERRRLRNTRAKRARQYGTANPEANRRPVPTAGQSQRQAEDRARGADADQRIAVGAKGAASVGGRPGPLNIWQRADHATDNRHGGSGYPANPNSGQHGRDLAAKGRARTVAIPDYQAVKRCE
jgi:hypothetical protein